jgi:hypothetical protein
MAGNAGSSAWCVFRYRPSSDTRLDEPAVSLLRIIQSFITDSGLPPRTGEVGGVGR